MNIHTRNAMKVDVLSIVSLLMGVICFVLLELVTSKFIYMAVCLLFSIIGLALSFAARINIRKTEARGKKVALSGLILNLIASGGLIIWMIRSALGTPAFGVNAEEDRRMILFIVACFAVCGLLAIISVWYRKIAKKDSRQLDRTI